MPLPIVHYAQSRSNPSVLYALRQHPSGQLVCECERYQFSRSPKHCYHTEAAYEERRKASRMSQQRKGGFDYGKTDYVEVAERVQQFYARFPDGSLDTEWPPEVIRIGNGEFIAVKALAYRNPDDTRPGVGVAWEPVPGTTSFTKNSELMNAQTAAWGRAIAALGFATKGSLASHEEVRNRQAERDPGPERPRGGTGDMPWDDDPPEDDSGTRWKEFAADLGDALKRHRVTAKGAGISVDQVRSAFEGGQSLEAITRWIRDEYEKRHGPPASVVSFRALMVTEDLTEADVRTALSLAPGDDIDLAIDECVQQHKGSPQAAIATVRSLSADLSTTGATA